MTAWTHNPFSSAALALPTDGPSTFVEAAIYKVHDSESFARIRESTVPLLAQEPGFLSWHRLVEDDGSLHADLVTWSSESEAQAAAEKFQSSETYAPFVGGIREIVHFSHYWAQADRASIDSWLENAPLVEIALYSVKDADTHRKARVSVYEQLPARPGMRGGTYLSSSQAHDGFGDLLTWQTRLDFEKTGEAMQAMPEHAPFFSGIENLHVFTLFTSSPW